MRERKEKKKAFCWKPIITKKQFSVWLKIVFNNKTKTWFIKYPKAMNSFFWRLVKIVLVLYFFPVKLCKI